MAHPFQPVKVAADDIIDALFGQPLDRREPSYLSIGAICPEQAVRDALAGVLDESLGSDLRLDDPVLTVTKAQFDSVRNKIIGEATSLFQLVSAVGCLPEFVEWARSFSSIATDCKCIGSFIRYPYPGCLQDLCVNYIDEDGNCAPRPCFTSTASHVVSVLWQRYGEVWRRSSFESMAHDHCVGQKCKCRFWARCRRGG